MISNDGTEQFLNRFLQKFSEYQPAFDEHLRRNEYNQEARYVFFHFVVAEHLTFFLENGMEIEKVTAIFRFLEEAFIEGDRHVKQILEEFVLAKIVKDRSILEQAKNYLGKVLKKRATEIQESDDYYQCGMECFEEENFEHALDFFKESLTLFEIEETHLRIRECITKLTKI